VPVAGSYDGYHALLFLHILCSIVWVGGAAITQVYALLALRTRDATRIAGFAKDVEWIGTRVFMPSSILLLLFGIGMVEKVHWSWGDAWIVFGLVVLAASAITGMAFLGPEAGRIDRAVAAGGAGSPEAQRRIRRIFVISRIELLLLVLAVFVMVFKPA
jgi:uncharacterized membrane protein